MGVFRVLSGMLGVGSAGLALAERLGASPVEVAELQSAAVERTPLEDWNVMYPSQSESAALLNAALGRARESAGLAAF